MGGGAPTTKEQPTAKQKPSAKAQGTRGWKPEKLRDNGGADKRRGKKNTKHGAAARTTARHKRGGGGNHQATNNQHTAPRPGATGAGNQRKQETKGARGKRQWRRKKNKRAKGGGEGTNKGPRKGQPQPGGGRTKQKDKTAQRKGEAHQYAPRRPARPTRPEQTSTRTHARGPGVASSDPQGEVSASTPNSPGAPAESPVEQRTLQETGRVSDRVHTRQPPQRTQLRTDAGGTRQGQPHRGAPNGYDAERAQRPCLGGGQRQAQ